MSPPGEVALSLASWDGMGWDGARLVHCSSTHTVTVGPSRGQDVQPGDISLLSGRSDIPDN